MQKKQVEQKEQGGINFPCDKREELSPAQTNFRVRLGTGETLLAQTAAVFVQPRAGVPARICQTLAVTLI